MPDRSYAELQQSYGGRYIAQRNGRVVTSAETYDQLSRQLDEAGTNWSDLIIEHVEPVDVVCVY